MIGFTKERIEQFIKNPLEHGLTRSEQMEMARQLLTSMEQEPVAFIDRANLDYLESGADADVWPASGAGSDDVLLYAAPQLPQPAVPDIATVETTYPDVQTNWQDAKMYAEGWNACRSVMLQGAEPVTTANKLRDAVDTIRNSGIAIDGEKILAERDALNSPVIQDGWVACSDRMPKKNDKVLIFIDFNSEYVPPSIHDAEFTGSTFRRGGATVNVFPLEDGYGVTHWQPLPAAPQQEVK